MPRCLSICCLSRKKRKSFPINNAKHPQAEINKIFVRHVESIRMPKQETIKQQDKKTKSKAAVVNDIHLSDKKTTSKENNSSRTRTPLSKLFSKPKEITTPSPIPISSKNICEQDQSSSSGWSSTTNSDKINQSSCVQSYDFDKDMTSKKKKISNDKKPSVKSKLVLQNVRKMIENQNGQEQQLNSNRQKESVRL